MEYILTVIFSNYSIEKIFNFLADYLGAQAGDIGPWKIVRKQTKEKSILDTNRMFMLMKKSLYLKAVNLHFTHGRNNKIDFSISEYALTDTNYLKNNFVNSNTNLHIKIPKNLLANECETLLDDKMKQFVYCGLLKNENYYMRTPLLSRLTGDHRGYINLYFNNVPIENIICMKALLDDSILYKDPLNTFYISALWYKSPKKSKI